MQRFRKMLIGPALAFALMPARPVEASPSFDIFAYCTYMGDVRSDYGTRGALWHCDMWEDGTWIGSFTIVEPY